MAHKGHIPWNKGISHSLETREKIRLIRAKQPSNKGWHMTETQKERVRLGVQKTFSDGRNTWNKGKPMREETKQKLSAHFKGRSNIALIGRHHSEETKYKLRQQKLGKSLSPEHRDKLAAILRGIVRTPESYPRGENHHNYGKPAQKGSGIGKGSYCLKGHWVRSTWERGIADWLFKQNISYEYEPKLFDLGDGIRYRPDFYLPTFDRWIECKGYMTDSAREKISRFKQLGHSLQIIDRPWWRRYTGGCDWIPDKYNASMSL